MISESYYLAVYIQGSLIVVNEGLRVLNSAVRIQL